MSAPASSRRAVLTGLALLPAATLPACVPQPAEAAVSPDAALIAQAALVMRLAKRADAAWLRASEADDSYMLAKPKRPTMERTFPSWAVYPECSAAELRQHIAEADNCSPTDPWLVERRDRLACMETYEAECARLERRFRVKAADQIARRAEARLREAATALAVMQPTTMAGLLAKARASTAALVNDEASACAWGADLAGAVVRDLVTIKTDA